MVTVVLLLDKQPLLEQTISIYVSKSRIWSKSKVEEGGAMLFLRYFIKLMRGETEG